MSNLAEAIEELRAHPWMTTQNTVLFIAEAAEKDLEALRTTWPGPPCVKSAHEWFTLPVDDEQHCRWCGLSIPRAVRGLTAEHFGPSYSNPEKGATR